MQSVSRCFGIAIQMLRREHAAPHFHALHGAHAALIERRGFHVIRGRRTSPASGNDIRLPHTDRLMRIMPAALRPRAGVL